MIETIKKIQLDGVDYDIQAKELTKVTYAELKEMRDNGSLAAGHLYRITDYEFTTVQDKTKSAGHVFDIIVLATAENQLSHIARAIQHEGDTYFDGNDLGAWELWYELDNDAEKYAWADAENGKGVIYRMIDEKRNDCPYDFKNALFYNIKLTSNTTTDNYYYTFSYVVSGSLYDGTVEKRVRECYGNSMEPYLRGNKSLNLNVFSNTSFGSYCYSNTLMRSCYSNTFGSNCGSNTFGDSCDFNIVGDYCGFNTFGDNCGYNTLGGSCNYNTFGDSCNSNTLRNTCYSNTFGTNCNSNTLGSYCNYNTFGDSCDFNTVGDYSGSNTLGRRCQSNKVGYSCGSNTLDDNVSDRAIGPQYVNNTSITRNDEYFDDGSGKVVPMKHPDLSTQPSILPYKFMGQYVYEQLICLGSSTDSEHTYNLPKGFFNDIAQPLGIKNPIVIRVDGFAYGRGKLNIGDGIRTPVPYIHGIPVSVRMDTSQASETEVEILRTWFIATRPSDINYGGSEGVELTYYARIVYTSMPEGGDYYGYNNY